MKNDLLKLDMFSRMNCCQLLLLTMMTILFILKCDPKHILPNVQSVVRKPKFIMGHIYARFKIYRFLEKLHDFR